MPKQLRIHVTCPDDRGLLAAVTGCLFELGGDLGDATFAVLGEEAALTCVCAIPDALDEETVEHALERLPALDRAEISVRRFKLGHLHAQSGHATHVVRVRGLDRPGLVARLAEGFAELGANVVRFDSEQDRRGAEGEYAMTFEVWIPEGREDAVLANAGNVAESIGLRFSSARAAD